VSLTESTLANNFAIGGNGGGEASFPFRDPGYGGGAYGAAFFNLDGTVALVNSTIADNSLVGGQNKELFGDVGPTGGAIFNLAYGNFTDGTPASAALTLANDILAGTQGGSDLGNGQGVWWDSNLADKNNTGNGDTATVALLG